jgi:hypothetical protein
VGEHRHAEPPGLRTDVFGGSWWGWQALLTTHGTSILATQPLLVMDLSGQLVSGELTATVRNAMGQVAQYVLPQDLDRCGLLARLSGPQFADALTEAIHAGTPGGARADRAIDVRILSQLIAALDGDISPVRLAAATQAALGHPADPGLLTAQEEALIAGELFRPEYRQQIGPNLVRLDAFLTDLARYAGHDATEPVVPTYYTCLALDSSSRSAGGELLTALAVQWLTVQVSGSTASAPAVIIAGADELTRPHLERLADVCERRRVPLTLMFRHLREDALAVLGGGTAAFMRLGHHGEAEQAASYIGRQHTFVLSQLTATLGGNETHTRTDTEGHSVAESRTFGSSQGWTEGSPRRRQPQRRPDPLPQPDYLPELVRREVMGHGHQLERRRVRAAGLRVRRRAVGSAEPPRPRSAAHHPRPPRARAARGGVRPRHRYPARRQHPPPATSPRARPARRRPLPAGWAARRARSAVHVGRADPHLVIPQTMGGPPTPPRPLANSTARQLRVRPLHEHGHLASRFRVHPDRGHLRTRRYRASRPHRRPLPAANR